MSWRILGGILLLYLNHLVYAEYYGILDRIHRSEELLTVNLYFNITRSVNNSDFAQDFETCFTSPRVLKCMKQMNEWYRDKVSIWTPIALKPEDCKHEIANSIVSNNNSNRISSLRRSPLFTSNQGNPIVMNSLRNGLLSETINKYTNLMTKTTHLSEEKENNKNCTETLNHFSRFPDCKYNTDLFRFKDQGDTVEFVLAIEQHSCKSSLSIDDANFDVFARNEMQLIGCFPIATKQSTYYLSCTMHKPKSSGSGTTSTSQCAYITAILNYEHFDGISNALHDWTTKYPPLNHVLLDDTLVCSDNSTDIDVKSARSDQFDAESPIHWPSRFDITKYDFEFYWYSGNWFNRSHAQNCKPRRYQSNFYDSYDYYILSNGTFDHQIANHPYKYISFPKLSVMSPKLIPSEYLFEPVILHRKNSVQSNIEAQTFQQCEANMLRNFDLNNEYFLFTGSSHMRYNFDVVALRHFGVSSLFGRHRQHEDLLIENLQYNVSLYCHVQARMIESMCRRVVDHNETRRVTIVLQTGAWDLSVTTLRRVFGGENGGKYLLNTIFKVINGDIPCGNIRNIVWITPMPHALCLHHHDINCNNHRGYRTTAALAALNHYYIRGLFDTFQSVSKEKRTVKLHVIDANSFIYPRLIFREDSESVCLNHFICRLEHQSMLHTVLSPGGFALARSLMLALNNTYHE